LRIISLIMRLCHFCGVEIDEKMQIFRSSTCPSCDKDLKICYNCRFYSAGAHWNCLESIPEPVRDKDRSNFCDYFQFKESGGRPSSREKTKKAQQDFQKLFGDG